MFALSVSHHQDCEEISFLLTSSGFPIGIGISVDEAKFQKSMMPGGCYWSGTAPFCAGGCAPGESTCFYDRIGDGKICYSGVKAMCCSEASLCPHEANGTLGGIICILRAKIPIGLHLPISDLRSMLIRCLCLEKLEKTANDPHDDYCPPGKVILCPPGAETNEDCKCLDKSVEGFAKDL